MDGSDPPVNESQDYALRFEDLTVDDDLPLLDRIVRYCRSGIALQRLVHVKMLAETAETVGYVKLCFVTLRKWKVILCPIQHIGRSGTELVH
jgi:hypothetical protein